MSVRGERERERKRYRGPSPVPLTFRDGGLRGDVHYLLLQTLHILNLVHYWNKDIQALEWNQDSSLVKVTTTASQHIMQCGLSIMDTYMDRYTIYDHMYIHTSLLTGFRVRRYFPNLSTTQACCWGTKLMTCRGGDVEAELSVALHEAHGRGGGVSTEEWRGTCRVSPPRRV